MHRPINIRFIRFQSSPRSRAHRTFGCSSSRSRTRVTLNHSSLRSFICYTHVHSSALLSHASSRPPTTHPRSFICSTVSCKFTTTDHAPTFIYLLYSFISIHDHRRTPTLHSAIHAYIHAFTSLDLANSCPRALPQLKHPSPSSPTRFTQRCSSSALALGTFTRARTVG